MNKDIEHISKIDSYLQGELTPEEVAAFENQLKSDATLRESLTSTQQAIEGINGYAFKQKLSSFHNDYLKDKRKKTIQLYYLSGIAASLMLILISYFFWSVDTTTQYYSYFKPYAGPVTVRSDNETNPSHAAFEHYERGEYDQAIVNFEKLPAAASTEEVKFYHAISYIAEHNPKAATALLVDLTAGQYQEQVRWYLSLCYLMTSENDKAQSILQKIQPGEYQYEQARKILKTL